MGIRLKNRENHTVLRTHLNLYPTAICDNLAWIQMLEMHACCRKIRWFLTLCSLFCCGTFCVDLLSVVVPLFALLSWSFLAVVCLKALSLSRRCAMSLQMHYHKPPKRFPPPDVCVCVCLVF